MEPSPDLARPFPVVTSEVPLLAGDIIQYYYNIETLPTQALSVEPFGTKTLVEVAKALAGILVAEVYE